MLQDFDCIVRNDPEIGAFGLGGRQQQMTDAWFMYLDAQKISLRRRAGPLQQVFAIAEANLERARRLSAKARVQVEDDGFEVDAKSRPILFTGTALGVRYSPGSDDIASNRVLHASIMASTLEVALFSQCSSVAQANSPVDARPQGLLDDEV
jgi:hypothetical protein